MSSSLSPPSRSPAGLVSADAPYPWPDKATDACGFSPQMITRSATLGVDADACSHMQMNTRSAPRGVDADACANPQMITRNPASSQGRSRRGRPAEQNRALPKGITGRDRAFQRPTLIAAEGPISRLALGRQGIGRKNYAVAVGAKLCMTQGPTHCGNTGTVEGALRLLDILAISASSAARKGVCQPGNNPTPPTTNPLTPELFLQPAQRPFQLVLAIGHRQVSPGTLHHSPYHIRRAPEPRGDPIRKIDGR